MSSPSTDHQLRLIPKRDTYLVIGIVVVIQQFNDCISGVAEWYHPNGLSWLGGFSQVGHGRNDTLKISGRINVSLTLRTRYWAISEKSFLPFGPR